MFATGALAHWKVVVSALLFSFILLCGALRRVVMPIIGNIAMMRRVVPREMMWRAGRRTTLRRAHTTMSFAMPRVPTFVVWIGVYRPMALMEFRSICVGRVSTVRRVFAIGRCTVFPFAVRGGAVLAVMLMSGILLPRLVLAPAFAGADHGVASAAAGRLPQSLQQLLPGGGLTLLVGVRLVPSRPVVVFRLRFLPLAVALLRPRVSVGFASGRSQGLQ